MPSTQFYRRHELGLRMGGILIFAPSISGAFGGLLAAGLLTVPSIGTVHSWRKIFLVMLTLIS
jgi:MFS family permease